MSEQHVELSDVRMSMGEAPPAVAATRVDVDTAAETDMVSLVESGSTSRDAHDSSDGAPAESSHGHGPVVKQGPMPAIANLVNCILAAGAVGGPYALSNAGIWLGIAAYIVVALLMDYSLITLVGTAISTNIYDYQGLCQKAFGWPGYIALSLVQWGQGYGCMVTYLMIAADTVESIVSLMFEFAGASETGAAGAILLNRKLIIIAMVCCVILPICFLKDITSLAKTSYLSIVSVVFIAASVLLRAVTGVDMPVSEDLIVPKYAFARISFAEGLGVAAFSFVTHHEALLVYKGLKTGTLENWTSIAHYSMLTALTALLLISVSGYLTFYESAKGNVLTNYPSTDMILQMSKALFGCTMILTFPLEHFVSRAVATDIVGLFWKRGKPMVRYVTITLVLVLSSMGIALFTEDIGAVLSLTGGVCASTLAYIMPGLLYLKLEKRKTKANLWLCRALVGIGGFLFTGCPSWVVYRIITEGAENVEKAGR